MKYMDDSFKNFLDYLKRLAFKLNDAYLAFQIYDVLLEKNAPNVMGNKIANENCKIMKRYSSFFVITRSALRDCFLLKLAHLFDDVKPALSLRKMIKIAEGDAKNLNKENFKTINKGRFNLEILEREFNGITLNIIEEINVILFSHEELLKRLKIYRDKCLAHDDRRKIEVNISIEEVKKLLEVSEVILNKLSCAVNLSEYSFEYTRDKTKSETELLIEDLRGLFLGR